MNDLTHKRTKSADKPVINIPETADAFVKLNSDRNKGMNPPAKPMTPTTAAKCIMCFRQAGLMSVTMPQNASAIPNQAGINAVRLTESLLPSRSGSN